MSAIRRHSLSASRFREADPLCGTSYKLSAASFGLVEVVIGVSILTVSIGVLFGVIVASQKIAAEATIKIQVALLLQEGAEAVRYLRDANLNTWSTFKAHGNGPSAVSKCLGISNNQYTLSDAAVSAPFCTPIFTQPASTGVSLVRTLSFRCANRDTSSNMITSWGGCTSVNDTNVIKAKITVSWAGRNGATKSEYLETIVTNR